MARIRIERVSRRFGGVTALEDLSLDIAHGEFLVLLGPSGCGKSTLLRTIAGLLAPDSGRILLDDSDVTDLPARDRGVAMVFQSYALYPHLSVARNIAFPLRARRTDRAERDARVAEVGAALGLSGLLDRRPRELSGGQRQRVALARALVRDPAAFLLDEPLSNLDARLRTSTRAELTELHRRLGSTFVHVTHDQVEAMTMATRIALLDGGRLEQVGAPHEVYDRPESAFVAGFLGAPPMNLLPARLAERDGALHAVADGVDIPVGLPVEQPEGSTAAEDSGRDVLLGVRPEQLSVRRDGAPGGGLRGRVRLLENLGGEEVAHCLVGGIRVAVRGTRPLGVAVDDPLALDCPSEFVHLFAPTSGRRLERRARDRIHVPI
ncbi:ABC transporter ATP-binding protein [Pseudonocardia humida]|uniref:ABC transporter ATP-binding protein n=1 Tax=Pseudonocardia humida TaxID=2800819 RepID=A0ABT1A6C0_9PSEU|nr:ATP-binding cassette domain-containing protein [Pseudonocardia humida]MCO1658520.1 ABC transporter ATP-binding protein [Pseudonocardia humida]